MKLTLKIAQNRKRYQRGAVALEYGLIVALMVVVAIPAFQSLGNETDGMYAKISTKISAAFSR